VVAGSLRSFLRYLQFHGRCNAALLAAVPRIAHWRLSHLPPSLSKDQLRAFLDTFNRSTPTGRRDYAMALCQVVLGFRASEVAGLLLDNIDWHWAVARIETAKGGRTRELPVVKRVGQAIADYLRRGRPSSPCRNVFVRHRAPTGPVSTAVIREAIRGAFAKVEGCEHRTGTHVLRHTAATDMLCQGASLKEIADVLGHRSIETTTIYAKVDLPGLNTVTMPWPEVEP
jgi:site-specific recombinase XerD